MTRRTGQLLELVPVSENDVSLTAIAEMGGMQSSVSCLPTASPAWMPTGGAQSPALTPGRTHHDLRRPTAYCAFLVHAHFAAGG